MMKPSRRIFLKWIPSAGAVCLSGCEEKKEDPEAKAARISKVSFKKETLPKSGRLENPEEASIDPSLRQVWYCCADLRSTFERVQSLRLENAVRSAGGLTMRVLDAEGDALRQAKHLEDAQRQRIPFVILQPVLMSMALPLLAPLRSAGSFIIGVDEQFADSACDAVIYCDPFKLGQQAGTEILAALKRKAADERLSTVSGRVVQLTFDDAKSYASKRRCEGFAEALKAEPGVIIVHDAPAFGDRQLAADRMVEALRVQHTFDVVLAHDDMMAQGASDALVDAKKREQVLIVGMDGIAGAGGGLEAVRQSAIDATVWQPMPLEKAFAFISKRAVDSKFQPPARTERVPEIVSPTNLEVFSKDLSAGLKM
jgi:ABC-type sugar transport system substrate-binding protein